MLGGMLGLAVAFGALRLLIATAPASLPRLTQIAIDPLVLLFALMASLLSGLLLGALPHSEARGSAHRAGAARRGRTSSESRERHRARNALVVVQVASGARAARRRRVDDSHVPDLCAPLSPALPARNNFKWCASRSPRRRSKSRCGVLAVQQDIRDRIAAIPEGRSRLVHELRPDGAHPHDRHTPSWRVRERTPRRRGSQCAGTRPCRRVFFRP